jgi:protoporphyrinogen oxidase
MFELATMGSSARTVILGAGIAGLTAAYELNRLGCEELCVYEQNSTVGGLCRLEEVKGFRFETVSHVLHFRSNEAKQLVRTLAGNSLLRVERSAWIYFRDRYVPYPFQTHLGFLPLAEKISCMIGYWQAWMGRQINGKSSFENFEDWIQRHFGRGIAQHFMIPYNRELWGLHPREMSADWIRPFVPTVSLKQAMAGFLSRYSKDIGYNSFFYYPSQGGMQVIADALASRVHHLHFNKRAEEIDFESKTIRFQDGETSGYETLISTIPLRALILSAKNAPGELRDAASKLRCTTLLNITCCLQRPVPHSYHWLYFPESKFPFFRLVFPSNISPALTPPNCSIVSAEISNPDMSNLPGLERSVKDALVSLGMIDSPSDIAITRAIYLEHAYPVHDLARAAAVQRLQQYLNSKSVWSIGRFGGWHYTSIDDAIVEGLQAARESLKVTPQSTPQDL